MHNITYLKKRLPDYLVSIANDEPHFYADSKFTILCPLHDDNNPSFSATLKEDGWVWHCFACSVGGDIFTLHALRKELHIETDFSQIVREVEAILYTQHDCTLADQVTMNAEGRSTQMIGQPMTLPQLHQGTPEEIETVARQRDICIDAVKSALSLSTLVFGNVCGHSCWIITDASRMSAEARRMDGEHFPAWESIGSRKAHALRGSTKSWPVGVEVLRTDKQDSTIMLVEGGPDYLAALHFICVAGRQDLLPVAMLGRGAGKMIDSAAMQLLRGRRVRIYPHNDADGGGMLSAMGWAAQLHSFDCNVDIYPFHGLVRIDGNPVKDLNDVAMIQESEKQKITNLLP